VRRIGTLILAVLAACDFSLCIGAQVLTFRTKAWLSFAPMPDAAWAVSGIPQADPEGMATPRFWHRLIRFRHVMRIAAKLRSSGPILHRGSEAMEERRVTATSDRHRQPR
jgi:hypothetical protein